MSQSSVAKQLPEEQRVVSKSLTQRSEDGREDGPQQTAHPIEKRSLALETEEGKGLQNHVKISDTPQPSEEQTAIPEPLGKSWVRKNGEGDDEEIDNTRLLSVSHSLSLTKMNYKLSVDEGILSDDPKKRAFRAFMVKVDPSVEDYIRDIEKLHSKIPHKLWSDQYLRRKEEYKENIKKYITCRKKIFKESKEDEEQKRAMVRTARESLETLRDCLLDMNFEVFAETEEGREIALLEEKARKIYQATTDQVREKGDQQNEFYADFLSSRNAFLCRWNRAKREAKQEEYTEQEIRYIDQMKESLQRYIAIYQQEVKRSFEQFIEYESLHERMVISLNVEEQQEIRRLLQLKGLKDLKSLLEDVKSLNKEEWHDNPDFQRNNPTFQEEYYEKYNICNNFIDQFKKSETAENILKVIVGMLVIRHFILMKESDALFAKTKERGEITWLEKKASGMSQRKSVQLQAREETHQELALKEDAVEKNFEAFLKNEKGKQIDSCLEEINRYLNNNEYIKKIVEKELNKFEIKKREIFGNYDKYLGNNEYLEKKQIRDLNNYAFTAKIKIEERIYVLFLHHATGRETKQLEEKYRTFADTIDFLFEMIPLDLQNNLRTPAKQYNVAKAALVKQLVSPERSESSVKSCVEKLNRSLKDQITSMKEKIWLQFEMFWHESAVKDKITDVLLEQGEYKQGGLESYIENILNLSSKVTDELYQNDALREALKMLFSYNIQKSKNDGYDEDEDQQLYDDKAIYGYLILLHGCMMTDYSKGS